MGCSEAWVACWPEGAVFSVVARLTKPLFTSFLRLWAQWSTPLDSAPVQMLWLEVLSYCFLCTGGAVLDGIISSATLDVGVSPAGHDIMLCSAQHPRYSPHVDCQSTRLDPKLSSAPMHVILVLNLVWRACACVEEVPDSPHLY